MLVSGGLCFLCLAFFALLVYGAVTMDDVPSEEQHYSFTNIAPGPERPIIAAALVVAGLVAALFTFRAASRYDNANAQGRGNGDRADCTRM
jgi:hypothetical protein